MKALFASLFAALFALASLSAHALIPVGGGLVVANSDDSKDDAKKPDTDSKSDEDKKPKDDEDKKS